jgi:hypothetical protein
VRNRRLPLRRNARVKEEVSNNGQVDLSEIENRCQRLG